jgi:hypothetical protein
MMKCPDCGRKTPARKRVRCTRCKALLTVMPDGTAGVLARHVTTNEIVERVPQLNPVVAALIGKPRPVPVRELGVNKHHPVMRLARLQRVRSRRAS